MRTALLTSGSFCWTYQPQAVPSQCLVVQSSLEHGTCRTKAENGLVHEEAENFSGILKRRSVLLSAGVSLFSSAVLGFPREGLAVVKQGLLAGRIPGLSEPDEQGWYPSYYTSDSNKQEFKYHKRKIKKDYKIYPLLILTFFLVVIWHCVMCILHKFGNHNYNMQSPQ